jgi:hypothetical protein
VVERVLLDFLEKTSYFVLKIHYRMVYAVNSIKQLDCLLLVFLS